MISEVVLVPNIVAYAPCGKCRPTIDEMMRGLVHGGVIKQSPLRVFRTWWCQTKAHHPKAPIQESKTCPTIGARKTHARKRTNRENKHHAALDGPANWMSESETRMWKQARQTKDTTFIRSQCTNFDTIVFAHLQSQNVCGRNDTIVFQSAAMFGVKSRSIYNRRKNHGLP